MKTNFVISIACIVMLQGCSPVLYSPGAQNITAFNQRGEVLISGGLGEATGVEDSEITVSYINGAFSVTDHFGLQFNWHSFNHDRSDLNGKGRLFDAGVGYFDSLSNTFKFECYGLYSTGSMRNAFKGNVEDFDGTLAADLRKWSLQPAIIMYLRPKIFLALSSRISTLKYSNIIGNLRPISEGTSVVAYLQENDNHMLLEPALTFRFGFQHIKAQIQYIKSINLTTKGFPMEKDLWMASAVVTLGKKSST